jgi:hypothetical protein
VWRQQQILVSLALRFVNLIFPPSYSWKHIRDLFDDPALLALVRQSLAEICARKYSTEVERAVPEYPSTHLG